MIVVIGSYYWWQKNQIIIPKAGQISCDTLKDIPSAEYTPENVKQRFLECFPECATSVVPSNQNVPFASLAAEILAEEGSICEQLKAIPSAQYVPPGVQDKLLKCFSEQK